VAVPAQLRTAAVAGPLILAGLLAGGCGSSSASAPKTAIVAGANHDPVGTSGSKPHRPYEGTGGGSANDDNPTGGGVTTAAKTGPKNQQEPTSRTAGATSNPCKLVPRAKAEQITGARIKSVLEAPLGPSCIYQLAGSKQTITVTVQATPFATIKRKLAKVQRRTVAGRTAYCGVYGRVTTYVPLPHGKLLTIAAPCSTGFRFAAVAVPRLGA
jgi:hypothetical protein